MANRMLPLLYLNLGGEMMYILEQRLVAQNLGDKSSKVLNDISRTMFNKKFIMEIFLKHQPIHSKKILRAMFDKLAHASIMKLNTESMDRLYDLMVMATKYQILMCRNPRHLVMITLNHIDAMLDFTTNQAVKQNINAAYELLIQTYCSLPLSQLHHIRYSILNFFQDDKVKVSIFQQHGNQRLDGSFVYNAVSTLEKGVSVPGKVRIFDEKGEIMVESKFPTGINYQQAEYEGGIGIHETGNRGTRIGLNMYANANIQNERSVDYTMSPSNNALKQERYHPSQDDEKIRDQNSTISQPLIPSNYGAFVNESLPGLSSKKSSKHDVAKQELNLLAKLVGCEEETNESGGHQKHKINLFETAGIEIEIKNDKTLRDEHSVDGITGKISADENKLNDTPQTILDLRKAGSRNRSSDMEKILREMDLGENEQSKIEASNKHTTNNDEDDLIALIDGQI